MLLRNKLVTVFGGSGFIGRHVVQKLVEQGARVRVAIRRPDEGLFLKTTGAVGQVELVQANIRVPRSVAAALKGADMAVNCVGILQQSGPQSFAAVQAFGAEVIAKLATEAGVQRLVHISAIGADAESASLYAQTKASGEAGVKKQFAGATILRPSVVFGPEDDFFNRFATLASLSPALPLIDGGHTRFQPVYVGDVAEAVLQSLVQPEAIGQIYELGGPAIFSFKELMRLTLDQIAKARLLIPVPGFALKPLAFMLEILPLPFKAPITRDQITLLGSDNVVAEGAKTLADLGIAPRAAEAVLETYMYRYRRGGGKFQPRFS